MKRVVEAFTAHLPELVDETVERVIGAQIPVYLRLAADDRRTGISRTFDEVHRDLVNGTSTAYPERMNVLGRRRTEQGGDISEMLIALDHGFQAVSDLIDRLFADDMEARLWWAERRRELSYAGAIALAEAVLVVREELIMAQTTELHKLAAPLVPLHAGILLLPLIGALNARRAEYIQVALLDAIVARQAAVVLIDITGVPEVSADVASHLIRAAQATRLLGAEPVLVGINPQLAQAVVAHGIDLTSMVTRGSLEDGVDYALRVLGKAITTPRHPGR